MFTEFAGVDWCESGGLNLKFLVCVCVCVEEFKKSSLTSIDYFSYLKHYDIWKKYLSLNIFYSLLIWCI
jgi:hypothetical protein